jgi:nucleoside-diphosphate-sugar epimerase
MKVTVTGSLGNIGRVLIEKLVANGHEVKVISSSAERVKEIEKLNAVPLIGSVEDYEFVKTSFQGSDAVYLMIPPSTTAADEDQEKQYVKTVGEQYAKAVSENGIRYVINLSSIGAHIPNGLGAAGARYNGEQQLNALENVNVLHLRPGMFMTNFYGAIGLIKHQNILGNNFDGMVNIPLTHPKDIANIAFNALNNLSFSGKQIQYIVSDEKNGFEIAKTLGNAVGKSDVNWVAFSDEQLLGAMVQSGFPEAMVKVYMIEIGVALQDGSIMEDYYKHKAETKSGTTLQDFAREFAMAYQYNN